MVVTDNMKNYIEVSTIDLYIFARFNSTIKDVKR